MVRKLFMVLTLILGIAPVHGMWSGARQAFGKLSGAAVGCMERAHRVVPAVARTVVPVAFKRTVAPERAQQLEIDIAGMYKGYRDHATNERTVSGYDKVIQKMSKYCAKLSDVEMHEVVDALHEHYDKEFIDDALEGALDQEVIPWSPSIKHMLAHHGEYAARQDQDPPEVQELANELIDYSVEEGKKGNVVFFHAQGWQWEFFEFLNRELYNLVGRPIPDSHASLRYKNASPLDLADQKKLAVKGVQQGDGFDWDRWNALFCNMGVYACYDGSNSVDYFRDNYDQSTRQQRNIQQEEELFQAFGQKALFEKIKDNRLFKKLLELHSKASNRGNFVTISLPPELAKKIVYPTISGGPRIAQPNETYSEGDVLPEEFTCAVDTVKHAHRTRFETKFVLVLGRNIIHPEEAAKAGVTVRSWNRADKEKLAFFKDVARHLIHNSDDVKEREQLENEIVVSTYTSYDFYNDLPLFKRLIDQGLFDINTGHNTPSPVLYTALSVAGGGEIEPLKQLIEWGADVNLKRDYDGSASLHWAAHYFYWPDQMKVLLEAGADVNAVDNDGNTPLQLLCARERSGIDEWVFETMVKVLLDHGADAKGVNKDGNSNLHNVIDNNFPSLKVIELLIKHGADVQAVDKHGDTPLRKALNKKNSSILKLLVEAGADTNIIGEDGSTPLLHLASLGEKELVRKLIIEQKLNPNVFDNQGHGILYYAVMSSDIELVKFLIEQKVNDIASDTIVFIASADKSETLKVLLENGADANAVDEYGRFPLHCAVVMNNVESIRMLLDYGAKVDSIDKETGKGPLDLAVTHEGSSTTLRSNFDKDIINLLVEHGARLHKVEEYGQEMFENTVRLKFPVVTRLLIDNNVDVDQIVGKYTINQDIKRMKFLLYCGLDPNVAMKAAINSQAFLNNQNVEIIELLLDHGADSEYGLSYVDHLHRIEPKHLINRDDIIQVLNRYPTKMPWLQEKEKYKNKDGFYPGIKQLMRDGGWVPVGELKS